MINWFGGSFRSQLAALAGMTFKGKRDLYKILGYQRKLNLTDYRERFDRNGVANRIVKALPMATWRGGAELVEDEDINIETTFEAAWNDLDEKFKLWSLFLKVDILSGIGRYGVILLGAPGDLDTPLLTATADQIAYMTPYTEEDAVVQKYDTDVASARFGQPLFYRIKRASIGTADAVNSSNIGKEVHYTRCLHVADGILDDRIFGEPRLRAPWNLLDDLDKISGGGAEAFWKRADQGIQWDLDATLDVSPDDQKKFETDIQKYEHGLKRNMLTRGIEAKPLGSDVADISAPVNAIVSLISASTGIPQRVLMGSEQGKLAAQMDRSNWDDRVSDRRSDYAEPWIVRPFVDRMVELGALPKPVDDYDVRWPQMKVLDDQQRTVVAQGWASLNKPGMPIVVTPDEIRERVLDLPPLAEVDPEAAAAVPAVKPDPKVARGGASAIHAAADRFRTCRLSRHQRLLQRKQVRAELDWTEASPGESRPASRPGNSGYGLDAIRDALEV